MLRKLNELHQVPFCFITLFIGHEAVVIVKLVHGAPILPIAYADDDDT